MYALIRKTNGQIDKQTNKQIEKNTNKQKGLDTKAHFVHKYSNVYVSNYLYRGISVLCLALF